MKKKLLHPLRRTLTTRKQLTRMVLENTLVGTIMGTLVGVMLRGYLRNLGNLNLDWVIFVLIGLAIGIFSGFERERKVCLQQSEKELVKEIRESSKELQKSEERFKDLFERANDIIFTLDTESRFVEINSKFEDILGYRREEWKGRSFYDLIVGNCRDNAIKYYWETLKGGTPRFELDAIHIRGYTVNLALANSPVRNPEGEIVGVMGIARDISESKKLEELQNRFISHVSHELRTPLTAMREFASLLIDGIPGKLTKEQEHYLERVAANIDRLARIIDNLLVISKTEEGKITLEKKLIDMRELISRVAEDFQAAARKKGLELQTSLPAVLPEIYADPDKITQVLTNLIGNALKFTPREGEVEIGAQKKGDELEIWVRDNGIGIEPADQEKIFDRFQQIRGEHQVSDKGAGLGLAISREMVRLHRGRMWVESEPGKGSVFYFCLPRAQAPKVLLVDDDPDLVEMYKDFLEPQHYRVYAAYNGEEALMQAVKEHPDLIILDIVMPKMNGYEVIGRLKENRDTCEIPVIILTGYGLDQERLNFLGSRALPALYKPINMKEFLQAVNEVLAAGEPA